MLQSPTIHLIIEVSLHVFTENGAGVTRSGGSRVGEYGRDHIFSKAAAGSSSPPPKPTHLPPTLYFAL